MHEKSTYLTSDLTRISLPGAIFEGGPMSAQPLFGWGDNFYLEVLLMPLRQRWADRPSKGRAPDLDEVINRILNGGDDPSSTASSP